MHSGVFQFDRFNRLENTHLYDKIRRATSMTITHQLWFIHDPRSTITTTSQQCFPHKNSKICGVRHTHIHARFSVILIFISRSNQTDQTSFHLYSEYVSKYAISVNAIRFNVNTCVCVWCVNDFFSSCSSRRLCCWYLFFQFVSRSHGCLVYLSQSKCSQHEKARCASDSLFNSAQFGIQQR